MIADVHRKITDQGIPFAVVHDDLLRSRPCIPFSIAKFEIF